MSTAGGQGRPGVITPGETARGNGDGYLLGLNRRLERHRHPVYVRLMGEMNNCDNSLSARGGGHAGRTALAALRRAGA